MSTDGVIPLSPSLDHVGPLALSVSDAWLLYCVMIGNLTPRELTPSSPSALRLAVPRPYFCDMLDDDVRQRFEERLDRFRTAGMSIREIEIPHTETIGGVYLQIALKEALAYHAPMLDAVPERYMPPVRSGWKWDGRCSPRITCGRWPGASN